MRGSLLALEFALAAGLLLLDLPIPALIPLVLGATLALGARGLSWSDAGLTGERLGPRLALGLVLGTLVAIGLHFGVGAADVDLLLLRGNTRVLVSALFLVFAQVLATEMIFRGYVISSMARQWGPLGANLGIVLGALLSVLAIEPDNLVAAAGAMIFAVGYGLLYVGDKRQLILPIAVHLSIDAVAVIAEFMS